ncbi:MAG TPA: GNAT family N-acetyltransferase [Candidatus Binatia bacterium]|nr:GNAT family N-acetyltransferase [Candidatus Binatia bacterium]
MTLESIPTDELSPDLSREVHDFLDSQDTGHPFQFPQWAGSRSKVVLLRKDGKIHWLGTFGVQTPLGRRFPWIRALIANRGPVCDDHQLWEAVVEQLAEDMRQERFAYLDVMPEWIWQTDGDHPSLSNQSKWNRIGNQRASLRVDLKADEDEIFANFRKISRYEVRRAERFGTTVSTASTDAEIDEFLRVYERMAIWKGFTPDAIEEVRRIIHWLMASESRGALLIGRVRDAVHGGAVIARCGRRCWFVWGANVREEHVTIGHILQWHALLWAKSHGCTEYDFGGYTPGATSGPAWFKEGFGGTVVHLITPYRRVIDPKRYNVVRVLSRISSWGDRD